jgi:hypothetical protein
VRLLALVVLSGCGRFAFEPRSDPGGTAADSGNDAPVASGLLLHYTFEPASFLDELAAGRDATCTSCPSPGVGHAGGGASFDGVADCLVVAATGVSPSAFTFAIWQRTDELRRATIFGRPLDGATSFENAFEIFTRDGGSTNLELIAASATLSFPHVIGNWHHVAGVFDGSTFTVYYDGVVQNMASSLPAQVWTGDDIRIGCDVDTGVELSHFKGDVDEARLYSRALSATEIIQLATE